MNASARDMAKWLAFQLSGGKDPLSGDKRVDLS